MSRQDILMKVAREAKDIRVLKNFLVMAKQAAALDDTISTVGWGNAPYVALPSCIGGIAGMFGSPATEEEEREWDRNRGYSYIPGVGSYRYQRRLKRLLKNREGKTPHFWSQGFGDAAAMTLATLLGTGLGASVGSLTKKRNGVVGGAMLGAGAGLGLGGAALLAGAIKAAIDKRRSKEEQENYANSSTASEWLIPGVGAYNHWKTVGRAIGDSEERAAENEKRKETKTAALQDKQMADRQQMQDNHVDYNSVLNYEQQAAANRPALYNPIDVIMNGWRYLRNNEQFKQNKELLKERSMDRYLQRRHAITQRWLQDYYNKQNTKQKPVIASNAR